MWNIRTSRLSHARDFVIEGRKLWAKKKKNKELKKNIYYIFNINTFKQLGIKNQNQNGWLKFGT